MGQVLAALNLNLKLKTRNVMNKLLTEAMGISETIKNSLTCSLAWGGATRVIKHFTTAGPKELAQYVTLASLANDTALEIKPTVDEVIDLVSTPPVLLMPNSKQKQVRLARGETEESIKEAARIVYHKNFLNHQNDMRVLNKNRAGIVSLLEQAFAGETPRKKLLSYTDAIVINKIHDKLTVRKATLMDNIYRDYMADAAEEEIDAIYIILDEIGALRKLQAAA